MGIEGKVGFDERIEKVIITLINITQIGNKGKISVDILEKELAFKIPDLIRLIINILPNEIKEIPWLLQKLHVFKPAQL